MTPPIELEEHKPAADREELLRRRAAAIAEAGRLAKVLPMLGMRGITLDVYTAFAEFRTIRKILVRAGLISDDEFQTMVAEETVSFLDELREAALLHKMQGDG